MELPSLDDITFDANASLQAQLHAQIVQRIYSGRLPPGTKLPASRRLSLQLGVSRNTVLLVIEQLKAEGFVESHSGRGVYIEKTLPVQRSAMPLSAGDRLLNLPELSAFAQSLSQLSFRGHEASLPFTPGIPDLKAFPTKVWARLLRRHQDRTVLMGFDGDQGYAPLREALAQYLSLSRGLRCDASQIVITQGGQQALSLCAQVLLNPGDSVLVENPGYRGAEQAFQAHQAKLLGVPVGDRGVTVQALMDMPASARIMYLTPTHQYPMGGIMPAAERLKLLNWAAREQVWLIEDDYDSEFHYMSKPIAALQGMAVQTPVIYLGSFSKTLFPALRLGYLVVPKPLVASFAQVKGFMSGETALLHQAVVADFIVEGHFVRHLRRMRVLYQQKWQHFSGLLTSELSGLAIPVAESAGMHLVIETPGVDDEELAVAFHASGYGCSALSSYYLDDVKRSGLVLGFAYTTQAQRVDAVERLRELLIERLK
ncbi:GntR family transcriptional regulator/MocR family aminotransferase [Sinobacterium caligoides]|uniref:GntR family transcriptional regulator/MocR family aminotransferase n=1 Tax=Sinobacterium caligoides TaxID=933926 RepID=A0A3N2DZD1_9GAMM|nr:PLP-dependent aminotransferase family protein [Sinobacterium caligoides]ROS05231.1 GntR family transcriptional regulator/MocR family aminotransferase [Sinobacterium caligoides]